MPVSGWWIRCVSIILVVKTAEAFITCPHRPQGRTWTHVMCDTSAAINVDLLNRRDIIRFAFFSSGVVDIGLFKPLAASAIPRRGIEYVKNIVEADFVNRQYYVTGDLTTSLYRPDCLFTDPTTRVDSVKRYTDAVKVLFDPENSKLELLSLEAEDDTHLMAKWRLQGYLKLPWHPYIAPYTGTTRYSLDSEGLIYSHEETWSISAMDAVRASLMPTTGPPPRAQ